MEWRPLEIPDVVRVEPKRLIDDRGWFSETFRSDKFSQRVGEFAFVQENESLSAASGTIRGLHFQLPPFAQGKLVRCLAGAIYDVAVDLRAGSVTYGKYVAAELSAANGLQLWIPPGFAHGFCTLHDDTIVSYKVTDYYSAAHDRGLLWNDPELGIVWPDGADPATLSAKDRTLPVLSNLPPLDPAG